jgi:hypothetical protein
MYEKGVVRTLKPSAIHQQPGRSVFTDPFADPRTTSCRQTTALPDRTDPAGSTAASRPKKPQLSSQPRRAGALDTIVENPNSEQSSIYSEGQLSRSHALRRKTSLGSIQHTPQSMRGHLATSLSFEDRTPETPTRGQSSWYGQQARVHGSRDLTPEISEETSHKPEYYPPTDTRHSVNKHSASRSLRDELRAGSEIEACRHAQLNLAFDIEHVPRDHSLSSRLPRGDARKHAVEETKRLHGEYNELITPTKDRAGRAIIPVDIRPVPSSSSNNTYRGSPNSVHTTVEPGRAEIPVDIRAVSSSSTNNPYRQSPNSVHTTMDSAVDISPEDVRKLTPQDLRYRTASSQRSHSPLSMKSSGQNRQVVTYPRLPSHHPREGSSSAPVGNLFTIMPAKPARSGFLPSVTEKGSSNSSTDSHFAIPLSRKKEIPNTVATRYPPRIGSNNVLSIYRDSSDLTESITLENMRKLAAQTIATEQKIGRVCSDKYYGKKMEFLIIEERRKSIREGLNGLDGQAGSALASDPHFQFEPRGSVSDAPDSSGEGSERGRMRDRESPRSTQDDYVSPQRDHSIPCPTVEALENYWDQQDQTASSWERTDPYKEALASATLHASKRLSSHGPQKPEAAPSSSPQSQRRVGQEHHVKLETVVVNDPGAQQTEAGPSGHQGKGKGQAVKQEANQDEDEAADKGFKGVRTWWDV